MAGYKRWYEWLLAATYSSETAVLFLGPAQRSLQTHSSPWSSLISPKAAEAQAEKEESGPQVQQTIPFSCLPPLPATTDRQLYGQHWPKTMRGIFSTVI